MIKILHQSLSLVISYLLFYFILGYDKFSSIILSIIVSILSTIPDYDYKIFSWANKQYVMLNKTFLKYILFPYYLIIIFMIKAFKHRGITHSIFPIIFFIVLGYIFSPIFYLISLSIALHILEDSLTVSGIQPFYPFSEYKFSIPILNTKKHRTVQVILSFYLFLLFFILIFFV